MWSKTWSTYISSTISTMPSNPDKSEIQIFRHGCKINIEFTILITMQLINVISMSTSIWFFTQIETSANTTLRFILLLIPSRQKFSFSPCSPGTSEFLLMHILVMYTIDPMSLTKETQTYTGTSMLIMLRTLWTSRWILLSIFLQY